MSVAASLQAAPAKAQASVASAASGLLQRKCACGSSKSPLGEMCDACRSGVLQRKLAIGASNDPLEREADRIADQLLAAPTNPAVSGAAPPRIQRFAGQAGGPADAAPASVDHTLASPGSPLEPALRQDMERRFGHDFSSVRVHSGAAAEQSARDVNANAYTVGQNMVFGTGRFAAGTHEGRRLIAHELTHVVQQSGVDETRVDKNDEQRGLAPISQRAFIPQLRRQRSRQRVGPRQATVDVRWSEDGEEFYHRLMAALISNSGFSGIDASNFRSASDIEPGLLAKTKEFHTRYAISHSNRKAGQRIKVHVSAYFDPSRDISALTDIKITSGEKPATDISGQKVSTPSATTKTGSDPIFEDAAKSIPANETTEQLLARERGLVAGQLARFVVATDRLGYDSASVTVHHSGRGLAHSADRKGKEAPRPAGTSLISFTEARRIIDDQIGELLRMGRGDIEIEFGRDKDGVMTLMRWTTRKQDEPKPTAPRTAEDERRARQAEKEELRRHGIPDRAQIYSDIFKKAEEELKDAGIMLATFGIEQLILWVAGGHVLKALGFFAKAGLGLFAKSGTGAKAFPYLRRTVGLGRNKDLAKAVNALGDAEAAEFTALMEGVKAGKLDRASVSRLNDLMVKVEANLAGSVPGLRVIGRMNEHRPLVKAAEKLGEAAQREADHLIEQYLKGNTNPGIGTKNLKGDIFYLRGDNGARVFYRENAEGYMEILAKADKHNEDSVIAAVLKYFDQ